MADEGKPIFEQAGAPGLDALEEEETGAAGNGSGPAEPAGNGSKPLAGRLLATGTRGVQRVAGVLTILALATFLGCMYRLERRRTRAVRAALATPAASQIG